MDCPPNSWMEWVIPKRKLVSKTAIALPFVRNNLSMKPRKNVSSMNATMNICMRNIKNKLVKEEVSNPLLPTTMISKTSTNGMYCLVKGKKRLKK